MNNCSIGGNNYPTSFMIMCTVLAVRLIYQDRNYAKKNPIEIINKTLQMIKSMSEL